VIDHPNISAADLRAENQKCWDAFYSVSEIIRRISGPPIRRWALTGRFTYLLFCLAFKRIYAGQGMAADGVRTRRLGTITRAIIKLGIAIFNHYFQRRSGVTARHPWHEGRRAPADWPEAPESCGGSGGKHRLERQ
jgi:hypothetical protein